MTTNIQDAVVKLADGVKIVSGDELDAAITNINSVGAVLPVLKTSTGIESLIKIDETYNSEQSPKNTLMGLRRTTPPLVQKTTKQFATLNKLFGDMTTGKRLHFLTASFFKTDDKTIYTYSTHNEPIELLKEFSEYYNIDFGQKANAKIIEWSGKSDNKKIINNFTKLINIVYVICKILKKYFEEAPGGSVKQKYAKKQGPYQYSIAFIKFIDGEISSTKDKIISSEYTGYSFIDDNDNYISENSKEIHKNLKEFDTATLLQKLLEPTKDVENKVISRQNLPNEIIRTLVKLKILLKETVGTILDPYVFTHKAMTREGDMDVNIQNYQYLADALFTTSLSNVKYNTESKRETQREFIENFKKGPVEQCIKIVDDFDKEIKKLTQLLLPISNSMVEKLEVLKDAFEQSMEQSKKISAGINDETINGEIGTYLSEYKLINERIEQVRKNKRDKIAKAEEQAETIIQLKAEVESGKIPDNAKIIVKRNELDEHYKYAVEKLKGFIELYKEKETEYNTTFAEFKTYIDNAQKALISNDISVIYKSISELEKAKPLLKIIKELQKNNTKTIKDYGILLEKSNEKIRKYELELGALTSSDVESKIIEEHNFNEHSVNADEYSDTTINDLITGLMVMAKNLSQAQEAKKTEAKTMEEALSRSSARRSSHQFGYGIKGGGSNTKELRQKLNTMSIKQLKRLSDKKYIEYGNKNTIKSLINNYMKHI